jgi:alpha-D-xyloside xylohydrolase
MHETYDFLSLPLLVRPNTVLPMSSRTDRPDYDYSEELGLRIYQFENGKRVHTEIPNLLGEVETIFDVRRENDVLRIGRTGSSKVWKVLLVNVHSTKSDEPSKETSEGTLFVLDPSINLVEIKIRPE